MTFKESVELIGKLVDGAGVAIIVVGAAMATIAYVVRSLQRREGSSAYRSYRQGLGRAILLGLEFLVGADIIRTVAIAPTFTSAGVLAVIVLIRTFLSMSLELEISGQWPWQPRGHREATEPAGDQSGDPSG